MSDRIRVYPTEIVTMKDGKAALDLTVKELEYIESEDEQVSAKKFKVWTTGMDAGDEPILLWREHTKKETWDAVKDDPTYDVKHQNSYTFFMQKRGLILTPSRAAKKRLFDKLGDLYDERKSRGPHEYAREGGE